MIIKLKQVDGSEKEFQAPYISALTYRKYLGLKANNVDYIRENPTAEQLDELVALVVNAFNNQFTIDEFYAGLTTLEFREKLIEFILLTEGVPLATEEEAMDEVKEQMEEDATPSFDA